MAIGPQAIWTSPTGQAWTRASPHGISPQLHGDSVWVITKTAQGYLAAGELLRTRAGRPDLAREYFARGWALRPEPNALACAMHLAE